MQTSIATVSLSGGLSEKLEAISAARFDAVEIFENDLVTFNGTSAVRMNSGNLRAWLPEHSVTAKRHGFVRLTTVARISGGALAAAAKKQLPMSVLVTAPLLPCNIQSAAPNGRSIAWIWYFASKISLSF